MPLKIAVDGLWHLGSVTAACLAGAGFDVIGIDDDASTIESLKQGKPPVAEPGLQELLEKSLAAGNLKFSTDPAAVAATDIVWITYDTPVDEHDHADVKFVLNKITRLFPFLGAQASSLPPGSAGFQPAGASSPVGPIVIISCQLPVGSTRSIEEQYRAAYPEGSAHFIYSPENLRLGKAIQVFTHPDRVVVGLPVPGSAVPGSAVPGSAVPGSAGFQPALGSRASSPQHGSVSRANQSSTPEGRMPALPGIRERITALLAPFTTNIEWMSVESAEMTKHALNAFLATSVAFINEIAGLCERVGADAREVERGLKSDVRIGKLAYLKPGPAFAGGTLARDISFLQTLGAELGRSVPLLKGVRESNLLHKEWLLSRLTEVLGELKGKTIAVLGLTYKPGTDTLRRSSAIETCRRLHQQGVKIQAFDPAIKSLPPDLAAIIDLRPSAQEALANSDAALIATEWPEFRALTPDDFLKHMKHPRIFDPSRFFGAHFLEAQAPGAHAPGAQASCLPPGTQASSLRVSPPANSHPEIPHKFWHDRGYLPHFDAPCIVQAVTFRLHDSLPKTVIEAWKQELSARPGGIESDEASKELRVRINRYEDAGHGECWLAQPEIARIVQDALLHFHPTRYRLIAWCVMPNHVHVVCEFTKGFSLEKVLHSWKSFTSHEANKKLKRTGPFWEKDYFDRYIRDELHLQQAIEYVENNPVKAKLVAAPDEWEWSSARRKDSQAGSLRTQDAGWKPALPEYFTIGGPA